MLSRPVSQMISVSVPMIAATIGLPDPAATARWKPEVVTQEGLRVVERREHPRELVRHGRELLAGRPLGGEPGRADLEHAPRLVHLVEREAVKGGEELERRLAELRRTLDDEGARAAARGDDAHRLQRPQAGAQRRPADAHPLRQLALGREAVAGAQAAGLDLAPDVLDDLGSGGGLAVASRSGPTFQRLTCHDAQGE